MKKILRLIGYFLYYFIARHLPCSGLPYSMGAKSIRKFCAKLMLDKCGKNVNIEHNAFFASGKGIDVSHAGGALSFSLFPGHDALAYAHIKGEHHQREDGRLIGADVRDRAFGRRHIIVDDPVGRLCHLAVDVVRESDGAAALLLHAEQRLSRADGSA